MRISDWSSDVCSSDLARFLQRVCEDERGIDLPAAVGLPFGLGIARRGGELAALRRVVREPELGFGQAERLRHADELFVLARVADTCLMAQRLAGIDVFVALGERHRGAAVRLRLKRAPCAAVGARKRA